MPEKFDQKSNLPIDEKKLEHNVKKLAEAVDKVYGSPWNIMWRNFLAGIMRAFGATVGYTLFILILIFIAQKTGIFDAVQNFWRVFMDRLSNSPFSESQQFPIDPNVLKDLPHSEEM